MTTIINQNFESSITESTEKHINTVKNETKPDEKHSVVTIQPASPLIDDQDSKDELQSLMKIAEKHLPSSLGRLRNNVFVKAEGCYVWDENDRKILDFTCGLGVTNLGHCHPAVTTAVNDQISTITHIQPSLALSIPQLKLIQALAPLVPPKLDGFYFANSGTEANEAALRMVKRVTGRNNIVVMQTGFHGRTYGACSLTTSEIIYNQHVGPPMGGVFTVPFPYWHLLNLPPSTTEDEIVNRAIFHLELLFKTVTHPRDVAAIFIEPVLGHGGYVPCPHAYLEQLRRICDMHDILLVVDEVQSGFGRSGKLFAFQHVESEEFGPDIITFGKGCANGLPLSGMIGSKRLMDLMGPGSLGGTLTGNAVSCAASLATLNHLTPELYTNVSARSTQLISALRELASKNSPTHHLIADVRGIGLMIGLEFRSQDDPLSLEGISGDQKIPNEIGKRFREKCWDEGLMILTTSCFDSVRLIPALIITEEEMDFAIDIMTRALVDIAREG